MKRPLFSLFGALLVVGCSGQDGTPSSAVGTSSLGESLASPVASFEYVYTESNDPTANAILIYREEAGSLTADGSTLTGGVGSGSGLGSQGALTVSEDGHYLFAVNAGSNELSLLRRDGKHVTLIATAPSGGETPISVTESFGLVYVLNAGGTQNVTGFVFDGSGLYAVPRSTQGLSATTPVGAAQVAFSPDDNTVVVTEKGTNTIDTFAVRYDGTLQAAVTTPSVGTTPFGFAFDARGTLVVSDAAGGAAGAGALSSYGLDPYFGTPTLVTGPVADLQAAPCWVAITPNGHFAYTTNTASGTVSGYSLAKSGALTLFADGGVTISTGDGSKPADEAIDRSGRILYVLDGGTQAIAAFAIASTGELTPSGTVTGLPPDAAGIVVR